jgi:hypothetical protein
LKQSAILPQNTRRSAEAAAGATDEVVLQLLDYPDPEEMAETAVPELAEFILRAVGFTKIPQS